MIEWKIKYGDKELPVSAYDVVETLGRTLGLMYFKLENDEKIKGHVQMKIIHEMDIQILELVKTQFLGAIEDDRKRHVHMKVVKKRRVPKIKGKPGDIVDLTPPKDPRSSSDEGWETQEPDRTPPEDPEKKVIL